MCLRAAAGTVGLAADEGLGLADGEVLVPGDETDAVLTDGAGWLPPVQPAATTAASAAQPSTRSGLIATPTPQ